MSRRRTPHSNEEEDAEDRTADDGSDDKRRLFFVHRQNGADGQTADDAGVDGLRIFEQQKEEEAEEVSLDPNTRAELADRGNEKGDHESADGAAGYDAEIGPGRMMQRDRQQQTEVDALEEILGLIPAHEESR